MPKESDEQRERRLQTEPIEPNAADRQEQSDREADEADPVAPERGDIDEVAHDDDEPSDEAPYRTKAEILAPYWDDVERANLEAALDTRDSLDALHDLVVEHVVPALQDIAKYLREVGDQLDTLPRAPRGGRDD